MFNFFDFEIAARAMCEYLYINPDETEDIRAPDGYIIGFSPPKWQAYAKDLHKHWLMTNLISKHFG